MDGLTAKEAALIRHWCSHGQRGKTPNHRVAPHEWMHEPFSQPVTTPWHVNIEPDQLPLLILGFVPRMSSGQNAFARGILAPGDIITSHIFMSMSQDPNMVASEDKWFIYSDGPDHDQEVRLHVHRSWSGAKMIELRIDAGFDGYGNGGSGACITAITWESDPEKKWKDADAPTYMEVAREVCSWVLNVTLGPSRDSADLNSRGQEDAARKTPLPSSNTLKAAVENIPPTPGTAYRQT